RDVVSRNRRSLPSESAMRRDSLKAGMTIEILGEGVSPARAAAVSTGIARSAAACGNFAAVAVPESGHASARNSEREAERPRAAGVISNGCTAETSIDFKLASATKMVSECLHEEAPRAAIMNLQISVAATDNSIPRREKSVEHTVSAEGGQAAGNSADVGSMRPPGR